VPDGYALVPAIPTEAMTDAYWRAVVLPDNARLSDRPKAVARWQAMLSAAPLPQHPPAEPAARAQVVGYRWRNSDHQPWTLGETVSGFDLNSREIGAAIEPLGVVNQQLTAGDVVSPAYAGAGAEALADLPGYKLSDEQIAMLLSEALKPEEIGGTAEIQHARVGELVRWFARLATGSANPKWARSHAFELAYFVATNAGNRHIDINKVREAGFKEGAMVSPQDRGSLERIGFLQPMPVADSDAEYSRIYAEVIKVCADQPMAHEIARRLAGGGHA